jgi:arginyl-tRNA synthetase
LESLSRVDRAAASKFLSGPDGNAFWEMILLAGSLETQIDAAVGAQEPAFIAKYAFQLAQSFNLFYHHHRVLTEEDAGKKMFLLQLSRLVEVQLAGALGLLGIESPEKM